jgi:uncharacterized protein (TIGR03083 family)
VENLARTWASVAELCAPLTEEEWKRPTALPGWSVQDNVSHLVDYESRAIGRPAPDHTPADLSHTKNPIGQANEIGVDARRSRRGAAVLDEFREVTAARLAQLRALDSADFEQPMATPAGPGTLADMLNLRVMDTWMHEQDIRAALERPGHVDGPAAAQAVDHFAGFVPYVVGKRATAPEGSTVSLEVAGHDPIAIEVVDGRARRVEALTRAPDVVIRTDVTGFAALVNGRDRRVDVEIRGDEALGCAIVDNLNVMI